DRAQRERTVHDHSAGGSEVHANNSHTQRPNDAGAGAECAPLITIQSEILALFPPKNCAHNGSLPPTVTGIFQRRPCTSLPPGIARWSVPERPPARAVRRSE